MKDKKFLLGFLLGGLMFASGVLASNYMSSDISYTPSDSNWKVSNVAEAINSLELSKTSTNYSTEEKVVGTWIDGKPIYQRTIAVDYTKPDSAEAAYQHSWDVTSYSIETPISCEAIYYALGTPVSGLSFGSDSLAKSYGATLDQTHVRVFTGTGATSRLSTVYLTLQYTKITDQAVNS